MSTAGKRKHEDGGGAPKRHRPSAGGAVADLAEPTAGEDLEGSRSINVTMFAEARSQEIQHLMSTLRSTPGTQRVFQSVPRHLRRRAASHNIKRLPVRLRAAAERERENDRLNNSLPKPTKSRRTKRRPGVVAADFVRRQGHIGWLETHIWHAKRMKMVELWGYRLALHANDKAIRAIHKAVRDNATAHDASYTVTLQLTGAWDDVCKVVTHVTDAAELRPVAKRYMLGTRYGRCHLYWPDMQPKALIAPVMFLWRAYDQADVSKRTLWLWVHPSASSEALTAVTAAITMSSLSESVTVEALKREFVHFSLVGPRAHATLFEILKVVPDTSGASVWAQLSHLRSPSSLPADTVIALTVHDPRLSFPTRPPLRVTNEDAADTVRLQNLLSRWPSDNLLARSNLWDPEHRAALLRSKPTEKELNHRRQLQGLTGRRLTPLPADAKVPLLLLRRPAMATSSESTREYGSGWDVVLPAGWGNEFWKSLMFAGVRVAGQRDLRTLHLESSVPAFPYDYVGTAAYREFARLRQRQTEAYYWARPQGKRPSYTKLHLPLSPFNPDPEQLVSPPSEYWTPPNDAPKRVVRIQARPLTGRRMLVAVPAPPDDTEAVLQRWNARTFWLAPRGLAQAAGDGALVFVAVHMVDRGVPVDLAHLWLRNEPAPTRAQRDAERARKRPRTKTEMAQPAVTAVDATLAAVAAPQDVVGFVTSAQYSLLRGEGLALAVCCAKALHSAGLSAQKPVSVWIRNPTSMHCWRAEVRTIIA